MTNPTPHGQVPATQRYKIGYHSDEWGVRSNTPGGIPDPAGSWVRYEDHLAALVEAQQPAPSAAVFGLRLVPVEPTDQMVQAAHHIDLSYMPGQEGADRAAIYRAMIAAAPQADSQPAQVRDERDDFEKVFPLPSGCIRVGTGYASTGYSNWAAHTHCERWQGWQARAARAPADSVTAPAGGIPGNFITHRTAWRKALETAKGHAAGDDVKYWDHELRAFDRSFDRLWALMQDNTQQPTQATDNVLEDAERWQALESCVLEINGGDDWMLIVLTNDAKPEDFLKRLLADKLAALAARKRGANHD